MNAMNNIIESVEEYFQLKEEAKRIEAKLASLRPILEHHIKKTTGSFTGEATPNLTVQVGEYGLNLGQGTKENFNHKLAFTELGDILKPYLSKTYFTILKVTRIMRQGEVA
jgi:hypothetical protein